VQLQNGVSSSTKRTILKRLLADIRELAPDIAARAAEIEARRRIPPDLVETLRSIGVFRLFVPQSHGGLELDLPSALEIVGALSRVDGSVGWTVATGSGGDIFAALLPRQTHDQVYRNGPDVILAGSAQPVGTAEAVAGGWLINGRWPFASGCQHPDWMAGLCVMTEGGKPFRGDAGAPLVRGFFLPARDWQIEDTWYVAGLKSTGSHHIALKDKVVSATNFFDVASSEEIVRSLAAKLDHGDKGLVGNAGYRRFLATPGEDHFEIDPDRVADDARFDGLYILRTTGKLDTLSVALAYREPDLLSLAEEADQVFTIGRSRCRSL
jgi:Acyl-CoA dehydrogenase, N-terminal domain